MPNVVNFGPDFERSLTRIKEDIAEQKSIPGNEQMEERELMRQSLEKMAAAVAVPPAQEPPASSAPQADASSLPAYLSNASADPRVKEEVQRLVNLAFSDHIEKAISEAKKHPPFVVDALHDALVDKLIPEMKRRGML
ncbi:MAG: hypothetical protein AAB631_01555 [Patescibacteria group bacterium]